MGMLVIVNAPLQRQLRLCLLQLQPQICDLLDPFVDSSIRSIQLVLELCNTIIIARGSPGCSRDGWRRSYLFLFFSRRSM
jgi:hypothetical protein